MAEFRGGLNQLEEQIDRASKELAALAKREDSSRRLLTVPGIGPLVATALTKQSGFATGKVLSRNEP